MKKHGKKKAEKGQKNKITSPFPIVGIGASAGGLEAIQSFFEAMPIDSGLAFVVIQHLSPDYKSMMVELLSRKTKMPVLRAEEGMTIEPNHVYLIPPKQNLTVFHRRLLLKEQPAHNGTVNLPVNIFLQSLAEDQADQAVAVILSGTGSDGTRGVRDVKEQGGLVLAQDEESAKFNGMPRSVAATNLADFILPPGEMPAQLLACLKHPYSAHPLGPEPAIEKETGLTRIFSLLRAKTKVDFTYYKPSTIVRRIERRIAVTQVENLEAYVRYLEENPAEVTVLYRELLIGVTNFFRDAEVMDKLREETLRTLLEPDTNVELRFWVAGCSTGEEAYSLAILAREVMEELGVSRDIKIFATDIDRDAILRAGAGMYAESIVSDLSPALLTKYFYRREEGYQISRNIREMVVFAQHNLVKDPPFTRIDMVSCRNLLIYLQPNLQHRALEMFSFSLRPGGILLLGTSETVGAMESSFDPLDRKLRIYKAKTRNSNRKHPDILPVEPPKIAGLSIRTPFLSRSGPRSADRLMERLLSTLGETHAPLTVVVNEQMEVLHTLGDTSSVFRVPTGRITYDISRMIDKELSVPVTTGIQKVFRTQEEMVYTNIRLHNDAEQRSMRMSIRPLDGRKNEEVLAVLFLEEMQKKPARPDAEATEYNLDEETKQHLQDIEQELQFTRENLQATIEELETSNEELQATNEELLASNEELQSTNEELQSTNEELYTVNSEYQTKIIELTEAQNDVENLMSSSRIGTLIVDEDLHIRRFSPETAKVFHIMESDIGRPVAHLSHSLNNFDPLAVARNVQETGQSTETDVQTADGRWYLLRVLPYRIGPAVFSGIVITMVDITSARQNQATLDHLRTEQTPSESKQEDSS